MTKTIKVVVGARLILNHRHHEFYHTKINLFLFFFIELFYFRQHFSLLPCALAHPLPDVLLSE